MDPWGVEREVFDREGFGTKPKASELIPFMITLIKLTIKIRPKIQVYVKMCVFGVFSIPGGSSGFPE